MPPSEWTSLVACVGILALAVLVLQRRSENPLGLPLGLWALSLFGWNFASMAYRANGVELWHLLDVALSPWTAPLALHVIVTFVGQAHRWRRVLELAYAMFGVLALWAVAGFVSPACRSALLDHEYWSVAYGAGWAPLLVLCLYLLVRHLRSTQAAGRPIEQVRTRLLIAALLAGGVLGGTELLEDDAAVPALGAVGSLASAALVSTLVLRFRLLGSALSSTVLLYVLAIAGLGLLGYVLVLGSLAQSAALLVLGAVSVTVAVLAAASDASRSASRSWSRLKGLASLGRFSAQLAHDIKNPLAALHGAVQYLERELAAGRLPAEQAEMLAIMAEQITRLRRVVDKYRRLGRIEPELRPVAIDDLVHDVLGGTALATAEQQRVVIEHVRGDALPTCLADRDLVAAALENVVANALDAMPTGGTLSVRTARGRLDRASETLVVTVEDTGEGMDPREQARAFADFASGKGSSGLGLAFVRMVLDAHGGAVRLSSTLGKGTVVELHLPVEGEAG